MENYLTNTLYIKLFILTNPMKGFEEENRTYLKTVNFGCITDLEVASYTEQLTYVEPLLLYRWWDDKKSYYDIKYSNYDEFRAITDND